jgi:hypothetical protein
VVPWAADSRHRMIQMGKWCQNPAIGFPPPGGPLTTRPATCRRYARSPMPSRAWVSCARSAAALAP